jgi:hypothetical protein
MTDPKQDDKQGKRQAPTEQEAPLRHKGGGRETLEEEKSGPQPEGNGGTGAPAAFPPHN